MSQQQIYPDVKLFVDGLWCDGVSGYAEPIFNPATGAQIGSVAHASIDDLDRAVNASRDGFEVWRRTSAFDRYKLMRGAAEKLRERVSTIAEIMTLEQGKPLREASAEILLGADIIDWFAEEARRSYGRIIPARSGAVQQAVVREPVGPVAAFTPWNFPINQAVRKISAAMAAGCSVILKGPEETPASCAALVQAYVDAGLPRGVLNLVFGVPSEISEYLITHPVIRKISFTGSTPVGKRLAALAGGHMKRVTMELGGHAPAIVFEDADVREAVRLLAAAKFRNAGQVCVSPTRFMVHEQIYEEFVERFIAAAEAVIVGNGLDETTQMGPLANLRRVEAIESLVSDAVQQRACLRTGGKRSGNEGFFFEPTVLTEVPLSARIMNEEPFGPVVPIARFSTFEDAVAEANRLPYGLAAYAYTKSAATSGAFGAAVESGMVSVNHHGLALPETPFGGIKDSGFGFEGGTEAMDAYLNTKFITEHHV
jgi:succinate-semialdehyde dehydrogenase/glutarate-semialdehyde dehydrogenase